MSFPTPLPRMATALPDGLDLGINVVIERGPKTATGQPEAVYAITVGQVVRHTAVANVPILSVQWVVQGGGEFFDYTVTQAAGVLQAVTPAMLAVNPLVLSWSTPGRKTVGVTIETASGTGYVEHEFDVSAPEVNYLDSQTGQVSVGPFGGGTFLRFGGLVDAGGAGIEIRAVLYGRQGVRGRVGVLQIALNEREISLDDGSTRRWSLNGIAALDVGPGAAYTFYQDEIVPLELGANAHVTITDAPAQQLGDPLELASIGTGHPVITPETYRAFLMFQPEGGLWVPLSLLTWTWEGYSQRQGVNWSPVQQPGNAVDPVGAPTNEFPVWGTNTSTGQWVANAAAISLRGC